MGEVSWDPKKEDDCGPLRIQSSLRKSKLRYLLFIDLIKAMGGYKR
jgi:hypothetical protein